jgi:acyl-CoA synthetase (NDP forming)
MGVSREEMDAQIGKMLAEMAGAVAGQVEQHRKPLIGFSYRAHVEPFLQELFRHGVPVLPNPERAAKAMAALVRYREYRRKFSPGGCGPERR